MKWIDRPSVTEMDRGRGRQTKCQKMEMPLKWMIFWTSTRMCYYILNNFSGISVIWHFVCLLGIQSPQTLFP